MSGDCADNPAKHRYHDVVSILGLMQAYIRLQLEHPAYRVVRKVVVHHSRDCDSECHYRLCCLWHEQQ